MTNLLSTSLIGSMLLVLVVTSIQAQNVTLRGNDLTLRDAGTGNTVTLSVPNGSVSTSFTLTLPPSAPIGQSNILLANSAGTMSWLQPGAANTLLTSNGSSLSWQDPSVALSAWLVSGNATTSAWNGTTGQFLGTTSAQPLVLATRGALAQPIQFFTGANGAFERMRINAEGGVQIGTTTGPANTQLAVAGVAATNGRGVDIDMTGTTTSSGVVLRNIGANGSDHAGLLIGSSSNGVGTAIRIGSVAGFNDPATGIEIEASTLGVSALPTIAGSGTGVRIGVAGTRFRTGLEAYVRATGGATAIGVSANATSVPGGLGIGLHATASGSTGNLFPLVVSSANNADVYLGSSVSDVPSSLSVLLTGTSNANTTWMHSARLSGTLTLRGTGTGVTTFQAGAQGSTNISYTLPTVAPTASNMVLVSTPSGSMSWANPGSLTGILEEATVGQGNIRRRSPYIQFVTQGVPGQWSIDLQGARQLSSQTASGSYSGILAGRYNTVAASYSSIAAGQDNTIGVSSNYSFLGAGSDNEILLSQYSMIGAGVSNTITSSPFSAVVAGDLNIITTSSNAFIGAGTGNDVVGASDRSAIVAGSNNIVSASEGSFIGAGSSNSITGSEGSSIVAGVDNVVSDANNAFIGAGSANVIQSGAGRSAIVAGSQNVIGSGAVNSVIVGGADNVVGGNYSVILGGQNLTLTGDNSVGFNSGAFMSVSVSKAAVFANNDVWLANNTGVPSEVRFFAPQMSSGIFPAAGIYSVGLRAPANSLTSDIVYSLPSAPPIAGNSFLTSTTTGEMSWIEPSTSVFWSTSGNTITTAWNGTSGSFIGTTTSSTQPLSIATRNTTPADIRFYTGANGASERMRIDGNTGNVGIGVSGAPTRKLDVHGTVRFGSSGTTISNVIKTTESYDIGSVAASSTLTFDLTVPNAAVSSSVVVSPSVDLPDGLVIVNTRVSASGVVSVTVYNASAGAVDPGNMDFYILVVE